MSRDYCVTLLRGTVGLSGVCDLWLFLAVPWVCLQLVIVVFPDHTHLLFWGDNILLLFNFILPLNQAVVDLMIILTYYY